MMDALSIQNRFSKLSKIKSKSTHQGYPPWGALVEENEEEEKEEEEKNNSDKI